ncbi:MAG: tellurite resistance TerB family protein [Limnoraphis robusta]|uniref:tellurite resistance TerB family protein n=1 Tax=Limnoraphis robusta TaxID=1118279 RepID=UPI002B2182B7|nr:tellurite resistance TerB family protein [Limnoraphis robusta]MEA5495820.1 tellurite resistance TerB family protein [Limnoraphis robusta BA-68 BA1]MEA5538526.1 tellurite resistance TerB family protein [Limnoraphis robusta Tam1]
MGLFGKARSSGSLKTDTAMSPAEAFAGIALAVVAADGYLADSELDVLITLLGRMHLFRSYPSEVMRRMFDKIFGIIKRQGVEALVNQAIKTLPHELYETMFVVATDLILADGEVSDEEESLLNDLCNSFKISQETANEIIRVMLIKNKG